MKTPEEWRKIVSGHSMPNGYYTDEEVARIQLDAFCAGMTEAAGICKVDRETVVDMPVRAQLLWTSQHILAARDARMKGNNETQKETIHQ